MGGLDVGRRQLSKVDGEGHYAGRKGKRMALRTA